MAWTDRPATARESPMIKRSGDSFLAQTCSTWSSNASAIPYSGPVWIQFSGANEIAAIASAMLPAMEARNSPADDFAGFGEEGASELEVEEFILRSDEDQGDQARNAGQRPRARSRQPAVFGEQLARPGEQPHRIRHRYRNERDQEGRAHAPQLRIGEE